MEAQNKKNSSKSARRTAVSAMLAGLSFVFMYIGTLAGVLDLCACVAGALCTAIAVIEIGGAYPWLICGVCGTLSLLCLPDKFCGLEYIVLGGLYPILKACFERFRSKVLQWAVKLIYFNVCLGICLVLANYVLSGQADWAAYTWAAFGLGNVFFVIFDIALTTFISVYITRLRQKLKIKGLR